MVTYYNGQLVRFDKDKVGLVFATEHLGAVPSHLTGDVATYVLGTFNQGPQYLPVPADAVLYEKSKPLKIFSREAKDEFNLVKCIKLNERFSEEYQEAKHTAELSHLEELLGLSKTVIPSFGDDILFIPSRREHDEED